MTGRLDQVDLNTDLLFVFLAAADGEIAVEALVDHLHQVSTDPFVFDTGWMGAERFRACLSKFSNLGYLKVDGSTLRLTDVGYEMATPLDEALTDDQRSAIDAVCQDLAD